MGLTEKDVEHVAKLARLEITDAEKARYTLQLANILGHAEELNAVEVTGVEPTFHVLPLRNVLREDLVKPSLSREEVLQNAPDKAKGAFRVPKIIE